ncbi:glycosyltransferase family 2 protein [Vibrio gallicus]|uniref:glycosyltransferase family 2 protein n=1 Tax=Vibrio gallicus TaxID=190897 RepID=UPI0021C411B6|nr:glycosyltransferase family 2 protein [Vibrio gallicus]
MSLISIVCPCYNEEAAIPKFMSALRKVMSRSEHEFEVVFVNDGSTDTTFEVLYKLSSVEPRVRFINLSRNFGKESALTAGIDSCNGDAVIPIDVDLQDPPELIIDLIKEWNKGFDVVLAKRKNREGDGFFKKITAYLYYKTHNLVSEVKIPENVGDYRLMSRRVIDAVCAMPENQRFMKGIFSWVGFKTTTLEYERCERVVGISGFNCRKLWRLALDGLTSFSTFPIRIWFYIGLLIASISFVYGSIIIFKTVFFGVDTPGYASIMATILFLGGVQLIVLGILGEYIGRLYLEVKQRPKYIIENEY